MTLTSDPVTLTFDFEHLQRIVCDVMKLCTKFERNRTIRGGVIAISVSDRYPYLNYSVFDADTLCQPVTLTSDPLTL